MKKPLFFPPVWLRFSLLAKGNIATPTFQSPLKADSTLLPSQPVEKKPIIIHGSVRSDLLFPQTDAVIGTEDTHHGLLSNTAAQFSLTYDCWEAGLRYEYQQQPLPGFEKDFAGHGLPYAYLPWTHGTFLTLLSVVITNNLALASSCAPTKPPLLASTAIFAASVSL